MTKPAIIKLTGSLVLSFLLLTACGGQVARESIKLGAIFALTSSGAFWGESERNAAMLAVAEINAAGGVNGRPVELLIEDNATDLKKTATAAQKLINIDKVQAVTGPQWVEFSVVAAPIFQANQVVMITPSGGSPDISRMGDYIFTTWPSSRFAVRHLVDYAVRQEDTKFAIIQAENVFTAAYAQGFELALADIGLKLTNNYKVRPEERDFRTIITKIKAQKEKNVFVALLEGQQAPFFRQAREMGLSSALYGTLAIESDEEIVRDPQVAEGVIYNQLARYGTDEFLAKYQQQYTDSPVPGAASSYDNVYLLANAMKDCGLAAAEIQRCLMQVKAYQGASGEITFDGNGDVGPKPYVIKTVRNGKFAVIK